MAAVTYAQAKSDVLFYWTSIFPWHLRQYFADIITRPGKMSFKGQVRLMVLQSCRLHPPIGYYSMPAPFYEPSVIEGMASSHHRSQVLTLVTPALAPAVAFFLCRPGRRLGRRIQLTAQPSTCWRQCRSSQRPNTPALRCPFFVR